MKTLKKIGITVLVALSALFLLCISAILFVYGIAQLADIIGISELFKILLLFLDSQIKIFFNTI